MRNMNSIFKLVALAICVFFVVASLFLAMFVIMHSDHEHDHNGREGSCLTCASVSTAGSLLKIISTMIVGTAIAICCFVAFISIVKSISYQSLYHTPVNLKVRINN